jgi:hypothetical protein
MDSDANTKLQDRIDRLEDFLQRLTAYSKAREKGWRGRRIDFSLDSYETPEDLAGLKSEINRRVVAVRRMVLEAGALKLVTYIDPPVAGRGQHFVDVFENVFGGMHDHAFLPHALEQVERAIGAYQAMLVDPSLFATAKDSLDIVGAVNRSLRPSFATPPDNERAVQDAVEQILRTLGVAYHRDKEVAPIGPTSFKPDFTIESLDLAIEIKLATRTHTATQIQRELAEDIAAYRTKWRHLLAIVYDCGEIRDPEQLKRENEAHFGVTVIITKH